MAALIATSGLAVPPENASVVLRFSETDRHRWAEAEATLPSSGWTAHWIDPDGGYRATRLRCMRCQARARSGRPCRSMVCIGAPLCVAHTRAVLGLALRPSDQPGAGKGLFTTRARAAGALLCPYLGRWFRRSQVDDDFAADYAVETESGWVVDALGLRGIGACANTALAPADARGMRVSDPARCNAVITEVPHRGGMALVVQAVRALVADEEVLIDYGPRVHFPADARLRCDRPADGPVVRTAPVRSPKDRRLSAPQWRHARPVDTTDRDARIAAHCQREDAKRRRRC